MINIPLEQSRVYIETNEIIGRKLENEDNGISKVRFPSLCLKLQIYRW